MTTEEADSRPGVVPAVGDRGDRRVRRDLVRNRARLLEAADELIAERGLDISLNELARRAGFGVGTVYRHFADKDALVAALLERRLDILREIVVSALEFDDPIEGLRHLVFGLGELQASDRAAFQLMNDFGPAEMREQARQMMRRIASEVIRRAMATGRLRPDFAESDGPMLMRICMAVSDVAGETRPRLWRRYAEMLLDGAIDHPRPSPLSEPALTLAEADQVYGS